jgi:hypothetical protein
MQSLSVSGASLAIDATKQSKLMMLLDALAKLKDEITRFENFLDTLKGTPSPAGSSTKGEDIPCFQAVYDTLPGVLSDCVSRIRILREEFQKLLL